MRNVSGEHLVILTKIIISGIMAWASIILFRKKSSDSDNAVVAPSADSPLGFLLELGFILLLARFFKKIPNWMWCLIPIAVAIWVWTL